MSATSEEVSTELQLAILSILKAKNATFNHVPRVRVLEPGRIDELLALRIVSVLDTADPS